MPVKSVPGPTAGATRAAAALRWILLLATAFVAGLVAMAARAQDVLPVPALTARVIDQTGTLGAQRDVLDAKLAAFEHESGPQIVILMVPTTRPEDIASYAYRVADTWKIGRRQVGDGILIVVAKDNRQMRVEVARDLEGAVPDLAARQIMDRVMRPAFRADDYAGGFSSAIDQLEARIRGENLPPPDARSKAGQGRVPGHRGGPDWSQLGMLFFVGVFVGGAILKAMLGRTLGTLATGAGAGALAWMFGAGFLVAGLAGLFALLLAGVMGVGSGLRRGIGGYGAGPGGVFWGGGGGFGGGGFGGSGGGGGDFGGGGGFSSGGGGSFGGGGASSDW
jgi:uncharacterized protein